MNAQLRSFLAAVQYFTRLPVPASVGHSQQLLDDASRYFPAVGVLVGVISATALLLSSFLWPPVVAAIIAVAASIWLTGAFHEDGLADATDGLGGGYGQQRILEIMRDSRIGTYGTLALVLGIACALRCCRLCRSRRRACYWWRVMRAVVLRPSP